MEQFTIAHCIDVSVKLKRVGDYVALYSDTTMDKGNL